MVALFENGVTVAMAGCESAASWSFSSQPAVTSVSLLSSVTSRSESAIPRLTLPTKPRRSGLRRTRTAASARPATAASAASTSAPCGPSITSTRRCRPRSVWRSRLARQAASSAAAP